MKVERWSTAALHPSVRYPYQQIDGTQGLWPGWAVGCQNVTKSSVVLLSRIPRLAAGELAAENALGDPHLPGCDALARSGHVLDAGGIGDRTI